MQRVRNAGSIWRSTQSLSCPFPLASCRVGWRKTQSAWYSSETPASSEPTAENPNPNGLSPKWAEAIKREREIDSRIVGLERIEALGLGEEIAGEPVLTGPFGTKDNPVVVHSYFNSRVVGCQGGPGDLAHDLLWHEVRREKPLICLECGQFFVLKPHPLKERTEEIIREIHSEHKELTAHDMEDRGYYTKHYAEEQAKKQSQANEHKNDHEHKH